MEVEDDDVIFIEEFICERSTTEIKSLPPKEDFARVLECPVCYDIPFGPITICSVGHAVCKKCAEEVKCCPLCQSSFSEIRCLSLESIISMLKFDCPYKNHGCYESVSAGAKFKIHTDSCSYRDILCNESHGTKCIDTAVPFSDYLSHLQKNHLASTAVQLKGHVTIKQSITPPIRADRRDYAYSCVILDNTTFLEKCRITDTVIYWWISVLADKLVANQYTALLEWQSIDKKEITRWRIPVLSIRDEVNENSPDVAAYPLNDLLKLCSPKTPEEKDGKKKYSWQFQISIRKTKGIANKEAKKVEPKTPPQRKRIYLPRMSKVFKRLI